MRWSPPLFAAVLLLCAGCKKNFEKYYGNTGSASVYLYDKLKQDSNFSIFARGLERTGLVQYINNGGVYTVFAPVNNAFRQYFAAKGYASVDAVPVDTLFSVLNFHVINNLWYYYTLQQRYSMYQQVLYLTRGRKFVSIDVTARDTLKINGVPVIKAFRDISADNAVIHGIGTVLQQLPNLEQALQTDPQLSKSTFYRLMQVLKDSTFDRFNSYDKNGDGRIDSTFYKTYALLFNVYTSIEFRQNTTTTDQGGDPVFTTILMPVDDSLNRVIAPALARVPGGVSDPIAALSP
ncbi:MAG: fasciclin domain-containing protein, partial [Bacteroidetes bacterium]|nr:fasciclin domain-containing protein [Bacteroidota bacterium]